MFMQHIGFRIRGLYGIASLTNRQEAVMVTRGGAMKTWARLHSSHTCPGTRETRNDHFQRAFQSASAGRLRRS